MPDLRGGLGLTILFVALISVSVVSMAVDRRNPASRDRTWVGAVLDVAAPVQKVVSAPAVFLHDLWIDYVNLVGVRDENDELRARVVELDEEVLQLQEALVASGRLERIAEMREAFEIPMLPSEVVGVDASPWFRSVLLGRGRSHGVRTGMPVISESGVVGLIRATSYTASRNMLLLDRQSAVDGAVQRSRTRGIVRGRGTEMLDFEFVARDHDVRVGDLVMTSGLGGVYPKGLRIGEIVEIEAPDDQLIAHAKLRPSVDFSRLEQVFVMLRRGPTLELLYGDEDGGVALGPPPAADDPSS